MRGENPMLTITRVRFFEYLRGKKKLKKRLPDFDDIILLPCVVSP